MQFSDFINSTITTSGNIGIGHSLGATSLIYNAIKYPKRWKTIFIIEPALFSPAIINLYRIVSYLKLADFFHPMVRLTKKRREFFDSKSLIFDRWRHYSFFTFFSDQALTNFIDASLIPFGNQFKLRFPKRWEIEIYKSMCTLDPFIWDNLHSLDSKLIVIAGEKSNTFLHSARKRLKPYCSSFITLPNTSHLLPFEVPKRLANIIIEHS